jgi:hypothetical protein
MRGRTATVSVMLVRNLTAYGPSASVVSPTGRGLVSQDTGV